MCRTSFLISGLFIAFSVNLALSQTTTPVRADPTVVDPLQASTIRGVPTYSGNDPTTRVPKPSLNERLLSGPQRPGTSTLFPIGIAPFSR